MCKMRAEVFFQNFTHQQWVVQFMILTAAAKDGTLWQNQNKTTFHYINTVVTTKEK